MLKSRDLWLICGQQSFRAAGYIFYATWFPTYLKETRGVTTATSGLLSSLPLIAVVAGSLLGGALVDSVLSRTGSLRLSRQGVGVVALATCAALIAGAYFVQDPLNAVLLISVGSLFAALAGPCAYAITMDKGGGHVATVFGAMNMAGNLAAAACPVFVALLVTWTGSWDFLLFFFAGIYVAGRCLLDRNRPRRYDHLS